MPDRAARSTQEVFDDHLRLREQGDTDADIARNYAEDVVLLSGTGIHHGHPGAHETARILARYMPNATWEYRTRLVDGDYAFLEWTGRAPDGREVCDGADSFTIRDGRIVCQTMHYTVHGDD